MIIPTTDNITKSHTFTAQNWLRRICHVMCLLLILPLIACGSGGAGTGSSGVTDTDLSGNDGMGSGGNGATGTGSSKDDADPSGNDGMGSGGPLEDFLKTDISKAIGEDDHLGLHLGNSWMNADITDLAIESDSAKSIKITVKEVMLDYRVDTSKRQTGLVKTLSYDDPNDDGRFMLKDGTDEWGQGLFSSNSDGSTVMGLVSKEGLVYSGERSTDPLLTVAGNEYVWEQKDDGSIKDQGLSYTFGSKALTTAVGYERFGSDEGQNNNDVWFTMTLDIPKDADRPNYLHKDADAILSITNWHLSDDINAEDKNYLPLPAAVSLKGGVGSNNLRFVKGDGMNYIDERFLNFGTVIDRIDREKGMGTNSFFDETKPKTNFYTGEVELSSITARLYGEPGSLANNKAVIAGTYYVDTKISSGGYVVYWGVYVLKQQ